MESATGTRTDSQPESYAGLSKPPLQHVKGDAVRCVEDEGAHGAALAPARPGLKPPRAALHAEPRAVVKGAQKHGGRPRHAPLLQQGPSLIQIRDDPFGRGLGHTEAP